MIFKSKKSFPHPPNELSVVDKTYIDISNGKDVFKTCMGIQVLKTSLSETSKIDSK